MRFLCSKCLRLWAAERVAQRVSCPHCGGPLSPR
jgi:DNA-directed RNA polymerase subunit RPC12/RpoP